MIHAFPLAYAHLGLASLDADFAQRKTMKHLLAE